MQRRRFSILAIGLLLLAAGFTTLWGSNYNLTPINTDADAQRSCRVVLDGGIQVTVRLPQSEVIRGAGSGYSFESLWYAQNPDSHWNRLGFEWHEQRELRDLDQTIAAGAYVVSVAYTGKVPAWLTIAFLNCAGIVLLLRSQKPRDGFCENCGYDIRSSPTVCPICGKIIERNRRRVRWGHLGKID